jgi:hypothetical protein
MPMTEIRNVMKDTAEAVAENRGGEALLLEAGVGRKTGRVIPGQVVRKSKFGNHLAVSINGVLGDNPKGGQPAVGEMECRGYG